MKMIKGQQMPKISVIVMEKKGMLLEAKNQKENLKEIKTI